SPYRQLAARCGGRERTGGDAAAAAEIRPDVLMPDRLLGRSAEAVQISNHTHGVNTIAIHGWGGPGSGKLNFARTGIGEVPEFLAVGKIVNPQRVADVVVAIE